MAEPSEEELRQAAFEEKYGFPELDDMTDEELERELLLAEIALANIEIEEVSNGTATPEQVTERHRKYEQISSEIDNI